MGMHLQCHLSLDQKQTSSLFPLTTCCFASQNDVRVCKLVSVRMKLRKVHCKGAPIALQTLMSIQSVRPDQRQSTVGISNIYVIFMISSALLYRPTLTASFYLLLQTYHLASVKTTIGDMSALCFLSHKYHSKTGGKNVLDKVLTYQ